MSYGKLKFLHEKISLVDSYLYENHTISPFVLNKNNILPTFVHTHIVTFHIYFFYYLLFLCFNDFYIKLECCFTSFVFDQIRMLFYEFYIRPNENVSFDDIHFIVVYKKMSR